MQKYWAKYCVDSGKWYIDPVTPREGFLDINAAYQAVAHESTFSRFTIVVVDHPDTIPLAPEKK